MVLHHEQDDVKRKSTWNLSEPTERGTYLMRLMDHDNWTSIPRRVSQTIEDPWWATALVRVYAYNFYLTSFFFFLDERIASDASLSTQAIGTVSCCASKIFGPCARAISSLLSLFFMYPLPPPPHAAAAQNPTYLLLRKYKSSTDQRPYAVTSFARLNQKVSGQAELFLFFSFWLNRGNMQSKVQSIIFFNLWVLVNIFNP